jgi:DNA polymerase elongation subunit (family B)
MSYISAIQSRDEVLVWERHNADKRQCKRFPGIFDFYVKHKAGEYRSIYDEPLKKYEFETYNEFKEARKYLIDDKRVKLYESDVNIPFKVLSKHYYGKSAPAINISFYDIEVDYSTALGFPSTQNPYAPVSAISIHHHWLNQSIVFAVPPPNWNPLDFDESLRELSTVIFFKNEKQLLLRFLDEIENTDILSGWNSSLFDDPYISKRIEIVLGKQHFKRMSFPEGNLPRYRTLERQGKEIMLVDFSGRCSLDYLELFKKYEGGTRSSYKLESVSEEELPHLTKLSYSGTLEQLYHNDFNYFVRYNIRDTEILRGFEDKFGYCALANDMCHSATGQFSQVFGTVQLADFAIINFCHTEIDVKVPDRWDTADGSIQGAYVLFPQVGMHEWIGSIDLSSLYPSAIRAINISPETHIGNFTGLVKDWEAISERRPNTELTVEYLDGSIETRTVEEWVDYCIEQQWAISGFGVIFSQKVPGVIPQILATWYTQRKEYQKLMKEVNAQAIAYAAEHNKIFTPEQQQFYNSLNEKVNYYDRMQYCVKIRLNSLYGCLTNYNFRFFRLEMGESVTGTGRMILRHQGRQVSKILDGEYNVNFPLYDTVADAIEAGVSPEHALYGPVFNGSYQSHSVIGGDTDSIYFLTGADNKEDAITIADYVGREVNKSFPQYLKDAFLCGEGYYDKMQTAREIVGSRGIFVKKKHYVVRVVDSEGKSVDKLKIMGLTIKKTTLPKPIANKLADYINRLLKGEDWDVLAREIVQYKNEIVNTPDILLMGLPKGIKGIEAYTIEYAIHGNKTRLPGHVAAGIHYNECLKLYGDNNSPEITSGMKIKTYYLTRTFGKFKSIALPTDIDSIPDWFTQNFVQIIDRDAQLERLINKPLEHILTAIKTDVPSEQTLLIQDLLEF